jgi:glucokinase
MANILAADIGGTHSRFAHFTVEAERRLSRVESRWLKTTEAQSLAELVSQLRKTGFGLPPEKSDIAVLAIAGPVQKGTIATPPNIDWDIDLTQSASAIGFRRCLLINDFTAQAYACRSPVVHAARQILPGQADPEAALAVIGAGTGLGHAALVPSAGGGFVAVPSEGGHVSFPFETEEEWAYAAFLSHEVGEPYVRAEIVVSGRGLSLAHQYLSGEKCTPSEVAGQIDQHPDTLRWMARFFGREARNYALQVLARGGVYIAGGVAAKLPQLVTHAAFAEEFRRSPTMAEVLASIPAFLNSDEECGLWGAAQCGLQLLTTSG